MIKVLVFGLLLCVAAVLARPQQQQQQKSDKPPAAIISLESDGPDVNGAYHYKFEAEDGTKVEQDGQLKDLPDEEGKPSKGEVSQGSYSYVGDDGQTYSITYTADETGYHPQGAHLPVAPPIPEAIQRSLDFLATASPPKER